MYQQQPAATAAPTAETPNRSPPPSTPVRRVFPWIYCHHPSSPSTSHLLARQRKHPGSKLVPSAATATSVSTQPPPPPVLSASCRRADRSSSSLRPAWHPVAADQPSRSLAWPFACPRGWNQPLSVGIYAGPLYTALHCTATITGFTHVLPSAGSRYRSFGHCRSPSSQIYPTLPPSSPSLLGISVVPLISSRTSTLPPDR